MKSLEVLSSQSWREPDFPCCVQGKRLFKTSPTFHSLLKSNDMLERERERERARESERERTRLDQSNVLDWQVSSILLKT